MNSQIGTHDPWTLRNGLKRLEALIADAQDGITQERMKLQWMSMTASHADLAKQVRTVAALEARLSVLREAVAAFSN